jgi:hypothetical protein
MPSISFILKRLKAMNFPEIFYRLEKELNDRKEYRRLSSILQEPKINFLKRNGLLLPNDTFEQSEISAFIAFKERNVFPWQEIKKSDVLKLFNGLFSENKIATIQAANEILNNRFKVFDRELYFKDEIDWSRDPVSHESLPEIYWKKINYWDSGQIKEVKYVWEPNRLQHFVTLAKAFYLTRDEKFAEKLVNQWQHWLNKNPYLTGINWTSALECTFRLVSWTWALQYAKNSVHVTPEFYTKVLVSVEQHVRYIEQHLSKFSSANNHLIGEAFGLVYAGCYFPELSQAENWKSKGFALFEKEIIAQVFTDGVAKEQTPFYQRYLIDFISLATLAAEHSSFSFSTTFLNRYQKMIEFCFALMDENGYMPNIGDEDGGRAIQLSEIETSYSDSLVVASSLISDNKIGAEFSQNEFSFWLSGKLPGQFVRDSNIDKKQSVSYFPLGGYVIFHKNINNFGHHFIMDFGPQGLGRLAAHGHADALSVLLSINNQPVLIDCGTYLYLSSSQIRDHFRGTSAHNTVMINNEHQAVPMGPFQWGRKVTAKVLQFEKNPDQFSIAAEHDGYVHKGIVHRRSVKITGEGEWIITDDILGSGTFPIDIFYHLSPCFLSRLNETELSCEYSDFVVNFCFSSNQNISVGVVENRENMLSWFSPQFGVKLKHPVIKICTTNKLPVQIITKILVQ